MNEAEQTTNPASSEAKLVPWRDILQDWVRKEGLRECTESKSVPGAWVARGHSRYRSLRVWDDGERIIVEVVGLRSGWLFVRCDGVVGLSETLPACRGFLDVPIRSDAMRLLSKHLAVCST